VTAGGDGGLFHEVAVPSEKAVKKVAEHKPPKPPRRRRGPPTGSVSGEVTYTQVRRDVWEEARRLATHPSHIEVLGPEEVIVWNHPPPWPGSQGKTR